MTERRYSQEEAAAIFERAAQAEQSARRPLPPGEGMTLAELQEIAAEVGIPATLVARSARALDGRAEPGGRTVLGLPLRVALNVSLGRTLSEAEWERLVVDLRTTFDARGVVRQDGSLRQWTNGNLQVLLEPGEAGQRLRFRTASDTARMLMTAGAAALMAGAISLVVALGSGAGLGLRALLPLGLLGAAGVGLAAAGALRVSAWARLRRRQFEEVTDRLLARLGSGEGD